MSLNWFQHSPISFDKFYFEKLWGVFKYVTMWGMVGKILYGPNICDTQSPFALKESYLPLSGSQIFILNIQIRIYCPVRRELACTNFIYKCCDVSLNKPNYGKSFIYFTVICLVTNKTLKKVFFRLNRIIGRDCLILLHFHFKNLKIHCLSFCFHISLLHWMKVQFCLEGPWYIFES